MKPYLRRIAAVALSLVAIAALSPRMAAAESTGPATESLDVFPMSVSLFATSADAAAIPSASGDDFEVLRRPALSFSDDAAGGDLPGKQSWWPMLYSALIPGTGELSMGYEKRGVALMALEVIAWTGYFANQDDGLQMRDEYEAFADANWTQQKFIDDHPFVYPALSGQTSLEELEEIGRQSSGSGVWPGYIVWTGKEEDKQHYYENIGKYDWFISGWKDFDPDLQPRDTDLRTQYRQMRIESNDNLDQANQFLYISLVARVFSLVETSILIVKARKSYDQEHAQLNNHWRFQASPKGFDGAVVAVEYNFK